MQICFTYMSANLLPDLNEGFATQCTLVNVFTLLQVFPLCLQAWNGMHMPGLCSRLTLSLSRTHNYFKRSV